MSHKSDMVIKMIYGERETQVNNPADIRIFERARVGLQPQKDL